MMTQRSNLIGSPSTFFRLARTAAFLVIATALLGCREVAGFRSFTNVSTSMEKTIYKDDSFLCDAKAYRSNGPARGDVVVFQHGDTILVKIVTGLPGNLVEGRKGSVSVNGKVLAEPYAQHEGESFAFLDLFGPLRVDRGSVFVLGDNRNHSLDSRSNNFGEVRLSDIRCKATSILRSTHFGALTEIH